MNTSAKIWSVWLLSGALFLLTGVYAAHLHLRVAELQREMEAVQKQNESLQAILAEREEQQALQKQLEEQLRLLGFQQQTNQQAELSRLRQEVQQISVLKAQNDQLKERLREMMSTTSISVPRGSRGLSGASTPSEGSSVAWGMASSPVGTKITNVALGKKVTVDGGGIDEASLSRVTDGKIDSTHLVVLNSPQWVQVDLQQAFSLYAVKVYHDPRKRQKYHDVIIQAAENPEFKDCVTLFNNDTDNTSGIGAGTDQDYVESADGKSFNAQNIRARYLRFFCNGGDASPASAYSEIEVAAFVWENPPTNTLSK